MSPAASDVSSPGPEKAPEPAEIPAPGARSCLDLWKAEMIALLFALLSLIAIVGTLFPHDGKPLPQWPYNISVNTLVSIYALAFKLGLSNVLQECIGQLQWCWFGSTQSLYDIVRFKDAGQGPWGSLKWLWAHHLQNPAMMFGAIIVILSATVDPFFQQLPQTYDCQVAMAGVYAYAPRSNYHGSGSDHDTSSLDRDGIMIDAVLGNTATATLDCPSGNCTFAETGYSSIAYCSQCDDISDRIEFNTTGCLDAAWKEIPCEPSDNPLIKYKNQTSSITSPHNHLLKLSTVSLVDPGYGNISVMASLGYAIECAEYLILAGKTVFSDARLDPWQPGLVPLSGCNATSIDWRCRGYGAASCILYPCVQSFKAEVTSGRTSETVVNRSTLKDEQLLSSSLTFITIFLDTNCLTSAENDELSFRGYRTTDRWLLVNQTYFGNVSAQNVIQDPTLRALLDRGCAYVFNPIPSANFYGVGQSELRAFVMESSALSGKLQYELMVNPGNPADVQISDLLASDQKVDLMRLYNMGNISFDSVRDTINNISITLTSFLRTHGRNWSEPATGAVLHYATCLRIDWPWLTFPVSLILAVAVLFAIVVFLTARDDIPAWKTAPLALVFHGPKVDAASNGFQCTRKTSSVESMIRQAKEVGIQLRRTGHGSFELVRAYEPIEEKSVNPIVATGLPDARESQKIGFTQLEVESLG